VNYCFCMIHVALEHNNASAFSSSSVPMEILRDYTEPHIQPRYDAAIETVSLPEDAIETIAHFQDKIARYLFEISCLSGLSDWLSRKTLPSHFFKYFQKAVNLYDESCQYFIGQLRRQGFSVRCEPGCAHCCCHMPTGISTPELIYLYYGMHQSGVFSRFFRRCLEAEEQWREVLKTYSDPAFCDESASIRESVLRSYHRLKHDCPFLQERLCQIYPYRPIVCRMHFSLSSPHWCNPFHFQNEHAVRFNLEPGEKIFEALQHLENRLRLKVSDIMVCGLLELSVNIMKFDEINWIN